jgi:metal-sulfur cluster biosynthetic enzyme
VPTSEDVRDRLKEVFDPEIAVNIVDLGLVYDTQVSETGEVFVKHTLTSPGCPVGPLIQSSMHQAVRSLPGVTRVKLELTFDPPWDPRTRLSDEVKLKLGLL